MREAGFTVLAKTTGSKPVVIFPDGKEREIRRRGLPSVLEEKKILRLAVRQKVKALVVELMSIHPECLYAESALLLQPQILAVTNVRLDHMAEMGSAREEIARSLARAFPEKGTVIVPREELFPVFKEKAERSGLELVPVSRESWKMPSKTANNTDFEFEENIRLALAVVRFLGVDEETALRGMGKSSPDFGRLRVWSVRPGFPARGWLLVSAFAANDPVSTGLILNKIQESGLFKGREKVGLLNLRPDRGDRTLQWLRAIQEGQFSGFRKLFLLGDHASAFKKKLKRLEGTELHILSPQAPQKIMETIAGVVHGEAALVGMVNMGGYGKRLVDYWETIGKVYDA